MKKGTYEYHTDSTQDEFELLLSTLNVEKPEDFRNLNLDEASEKVLKLDFSEQLHIIHCIVDKFYSISDDKEVNKNIEIFLAKKEFSKQRNIILAIVDDYATPEEKKEILTNYELEFGIKIIDFD